MFRWHICPFVIRCVHHVVFFLFINFTYSILQACMSPGDLETVVVVVVVFVVLLTSVFTSPPPPILQPGLEGLS